MVVPPIPQTQQQPSVIIVASPIQSGERTYVPPVLPRHKKERTQHESTPAPEQKEFVEPNKKSSVEPEASSIPTQKQKDRAVEKTSEPEGKSTGQKQKRKYSGKGRKHTELEIEEILDWYLETGVLPRDVSQKQRWLYKHHRRLPQRRELLTQRGVKLVVPEIEPDQSHVIPA